jgi:hypothetical protein
MAIHTRVLYYLLLPLVVHLQVLLVQLQSARTLKEDLPHIINLMHVMTIMSPELALVIKRLYLTSRPLSLHLQFRLRHPLHHRPLHTHTPMLLTLDQKRKDQSITMMNVLRPTTLTEPPLFDLQCRVSLIRVVIVTLMVGRVAAPHRTLIILLIIIPLDHCHGPCRCLSCNQQGRNFVDNFACSLACTVPGVGFCYEYIIIDLYID